MNPAVLIVTSCVLACYSFAERIERSDFEILIWKGQIKKSLPSKNTGFGFVLSQKEILSK